MTIGFSQQIKGEPTYFIEQINNSLIKNNIVPRIIIDAYEYDYSQKFGFGLKEEKKEKPHTIREDKSNRWKAGNNIHFVINNRTKKRFQFAPVVKCVSVQKIEIYHTEFSLGRIGHVIIDGKAQKKSVIEAIVINDGFEKVEDFFAYFNSGFTGKIIHWTNLKY